MEKLATVSVPEEAVQYVRIPSESQAVQYAKILPATAQSLASVRPSAIPASQPTSHPVIEYVPLNEIQALTARNNGLRRQQLAVGGAGVYRGQLLEDEPPAEAAAEPAEPAAAAAAPPPPVMPAPITPPTPQEIAMALQRIQVGIRLRHDALNITWPRI